MPTFKYEAMDTSGGEGKDSVEAMSEEEAQKVADDIDVVINTAGNVTFNPTLESALRTNVVGTQNVIAFTKRMKRPAAQAKTLDRIKRWREICPAPAWRAGNSWSAWVRAASASSIAPSASKME